MSYNRYKFSIKKSATDMAFSLAIKQLPILKEEDSAYLLEEDDTYLYEEDYSG